MSGHLGRRPPPDWRHVERHPYSAVAPETVATVERSMLLPWWHWSHDQGAEGSCVGHGSAMERGIVNSTQNRVLYALRFYTRRYDPLDIWDQAKLRDAWPDTNPGDDNGTSVRAAYDVLRDRGPRRISLRGIAIGEDGRPHITDTAEGRPDPKAGVDSNRWATTIDQMRTAIAGGRPVTIGVDWLSNFDDPVDFAGEKWIGRAGWDRTAVRGGHCVCIYGASDRRQAFRMKNSWGRGYPLVWLTYRAMEGLLNRDGEAALVTDR